MIYWVMGGVLLGVVGFLLLRGHFTRSQKAVINNENSDFLGYEASVSEQEVKQRNLELDEWGASIPVSDVQQEAMAKLWEASQIGKPPADDPLLPLSPEDRKYVLKICSVDFRPAKFGNANVLRLATCLSLREEGFNPEHIAIIVGMIFNGVGKKGLSPKYGRTSGRKGRR